LFASAESVAAAVAYVDARISLLAASQELSQSDRKISEIAERWRRAIEGDRFGLVAHVLRNRGCSADRCEELKLLHDPQRVLVNLRERSFEAHVVLYAAAWRGGARPRSVPETPAPAVAASPAVADVPAASTTGTAPIDYPTAASIPAISIMNAEPPLSPAEAQALGTSPPATKPAAPAPQPAQARRQPARDSSPPPLPPPGTQLSQQPPQSAPQAAPPVQIAPPATSNIPRWGGGN
jgi:hypothetical protein